MLSDNFREDITHAVLMRSQATVDRLVSESETFMRMGYTEEDLVITVEDRKIWISVASQFGAGDLHKPQQP